MIHLTHHPPRRQSVGAGADCRPDGGVGQRTWLRQRADARASGDGERFPHPAPCGGGAAAGCGHPARRDRGTRAGAPGARRGPAHPRARRARLGADDARVGLQLRRPPADAARPHQDGRAGRERHRLPRRGAERLWRNSCTLMPFPGRSRELRIRHPPAKPQGRLRHYFPCCPSGPCNGATSIYKVAALAMDRDAGKYEQRGGRGTSGP